jgi:internalin A
MNEKNTLQLIKQALAKNKTTLNLRSKWLNELPKEIGELKNLTRLDLYENQLTILPKEIGELKNLISLYLSNNQLTQLPAQLGELENLCWLDLRDNPLPVPLDILERVHEPAMIISTYLSVINRKPAVE